MKTPLCLEIHNKAGVVCDELFVGPNTMEFGRGFVTALFAFKITDATEHSRLLGEIDKLEDSVREEASHAEVAA